MQKNTKCIYICKQRWYTINKQEVHKMKDVYLVNYSVKGIKTLDQTVSLSFYKKTISKEPDTQDYNIKGIYGMNGSGKSGIVTSVEILRNLLTNPGYLANPVAQKNLDEMINKKLNKLDITAEYIVKIPENVLLFKYNIILSKNIIGKYHISYEKLAVKNATSRSEGMTFVYEIIDGTVKFLYSQEKTEKDIIPKTMNLLAMSSMSSLFYEKFFIPSLKEGKQEKSFIWNSLLILNILGMKLHVYVDESDDHREYVTRNSMEYYNEEKHETENDEWINSLLEMDSDHLNVLKITQNYVPEASYSHFEKTVNRLYEFLRIFKSDLQNIEIDRKEKDNIWICDLIMVYEDYKIHAEFESTGIKKLIKLFAYLNKMVRGSIVFIDELDSNLHDVYLCALLEYLMEYGEGQLCFTTHNVGPMDILKQHKKSIDFLSEDHKIYSWVTNGNYSPSKLYRNGMIEGSPFNVDSIDFIGVFGVGEEDE